MDEMHDRLLETFFAETDESVRELERLVLALADGRGAGRLDEILRHFHTLKGNASCLAFDALTRAAHHVEDAVAAAIKGRRGGDPALIAILLDGIDTLARLARDAAAGVDEPYDPEIARLGERARAWAVGAGPAQPEGAAPAAPAFAPAAPTIRVDVGRLDHAMELAGGLAIARGRLADALGRGDLAGARASLETADLLIHELEGQVFALRLVPLGASFERLRRAVRDLAAATGKDVHLELSCDEVEVDMAVAEALRAPLTHLVRNAIDHGIEAPAERVRRGKPAQGKIVLAARYEGGHLVVELSDDGAGLDRDLLLARAAAMGLDAGARTDGEIWELAFAPGLSTAARVGDLSGRGVGMDVVRRAIEGLRGSVSLDSTPGAGVTATLRLPLALSIMQGLAVVIGEQTFVLPLDHVVECVSLDRARAISSRHGGVLELRGDALPYLDVGAPLGALARPDGGGSVVVVEHDGRRAGLRVDELRGEIQTVIRPVGRLFGHVRGVAGSAILGDGRLALVVDVRGLLRAAIPPRHAAA